MKTEEKVARALCTAAGDDPDALAYPPMMHAQAKKPHIIYVPTGEYSRPAPMWVWYLREARAALDVIDKPE